MESSNGENKQVMFRHGKKCVVGGISFFDVMRIVAIESSSVLKLT
jgi:hypothetical protein